MAYSYQNRTVPGKMPTRSIQGGGDPGQGAKRGKGSGGGTNPHGSQPGSTTVPPPKRIPVIHPNSGTAKQGFFGYGNGQYGYRNDQGNIATKVKYGGQPLLQNGNSIYDKFMADQKAKAAARAKHPQPGQNVGTPAPGTPGTPTDPITGMPAPAPTEIDYLTGRWLDEENVLRKQYEDEGNALHAQLSGVDPIDPKTGLRASEVQKKELDYRYGNDVNRSHLELAAQGISQSGTRDMQDKDMLQSYMSGSKGILDTYEGQREALRQAISDRTRRFNYDRAQLIRDARDDYRYNHEAAPAVENPYKDNPGDPALNPVFNPATPVPSAPSNTTVHGADPAAHRGNEESSKFGAPTKVPGTGKKNAQGFYQVGGQWYFRNKDGAVTPAKAPGKNEKVVKP